jgi:hypothetical protein
MLANAQTLRTLRYPIASFNNLGDRVPLELFSGVTLPITVSLPQI